MLAFAFTALQLSVKNRLGETPLHLAAVRGNYQVCHFLTDLGASYQKLVFAENHTRRRCYDNNFLRFLTIFGEKIGVFLKNQCYDQNFA
jgi:ankyrin repeat protein